MRVLRVPVVWTASAVTRTAVVAVSSAALLVPVFSVWGREFSALRNWQLALAPLFAAAIYLAHGASTLQPKLHRSALAFLIASLTWWMVAGETLNFLAIEINGVDFSIFDWMLESSLRGRFMWSPIYGVNHFGIHQMWLLIGLVPIHALLRFPFALCLINVSLLGSAALVLWHIAQRLVDDDLTAALAVLAFATNPWVCRLLSQGFRAESFYPITIFLFVAAWLRAEPTRIAFSALLFCCVKEDAAFYLLGFATAAAFSPGLKRQGAVGLTLLASSMLALDMLLVQPWAMSMGSTTQAQHLGSWSVYGTSVREVIRAALASPLRALMTILTSGWLRLLGPALFLPLWSLECVGAMVPGLVMLGLASLPPVRAFVGYHPVPLACSAICGILAVAHARQGAGVRTWARAALLLFPLFGGGYFRIAWPDTEQRLGLVLVRAALGTRATPICAQTILFPQLGYPVDLRALDESCTALSESVSVLNPQLDPWPFSRQELEGQVLAARREGRVSDFVGGFAIVRAANAR